MATAEISMTALRDLRNALDRAAVKGGEPCASVLARIDCLLASGSPAIALADYVDILETAGKTARTSALPWSLGLSCREPFGRDIARAVFGCRSLGTALHWMCQYFPLLQDASSLRLDVEEDYSTLSYKILDPTIWPRHEDAMYTLGIYAMLIQKAAPEAWSQVQLTIEAEADQVRTDLSTIVKTSVVYGGSANMIRFPTAIINAPLNLAPPADPALLKRLTAEVSARRRSMPIAERTRQMIYDQMNEGRVSQAHIARELGISSRTLRRRLAEENRSFQMLLDECRMQFAALEFRTRRQLSLSDMALKLGYSEHSTFSRAFARWCGMAPQEYRRTVTAH